MCGRELIRVISSREASGDAAAMGTERVVLSLGDWVGNNLHIATEVRGVGVRLGKLAIEPDGVVSGQLGQHAVDCKGDGRA